MKALFSHYKLFKHDHSEALSVQALKASVLTILIVKTENKAELLSYFSKYSKKCREFLVFRYLFD